MKMKQLINIFIAPSRVLVAAALALVAAPAGAEEAAGVAAIVDLIRWGGVLAAIPIVLGGIFFLRLVDGAATGFGERFSHRRLTIQKIQTTIQFLVYTVMVAVAISLIVRLDSTTIAVIGGALAFAVGFAMRDLVAAFIAGVTIIFDQPFQVGDRVSYAGEYGDITKIGLRSVRMNTLDHNVITIPNNKVLTDVTSSGNYGRLEMQVPMDFYIGIDQNAKLATDIIREACLTSPYAYLANPIPVLARQVILQDYVALHLKVRPYVFDCKYEKPFETDVHFRVLDAFRAQGINPPAILHRNVGASSAGGH